MLKDDETFVGHVTDPVARQQALRRWRRSRTLSFIASGCLFLGAIASHVGDEAAMCGLSSGIAAVNFTVAVATDMKIKVALLADQQRTD